jgi:hypothetical protein
MNYASRACRMCISPCSCDPMHTFFDSAKHVPRRIVYADMFVPPDDCYQWHATGTLCRTPAVRDRLAQTTGCRSPGQFVILCSLFLAVATKSLTNPMPATELPVLTRTPILLSPMFVLWVAPDRRNPRHISAVVLRKSRIVPQAGLPACGTGDSCPAWRQPAWEAGLRFDRCLRQRPLLVMDSCPAWLLGWLSIFVK